MKTVFVLGAGASHAAGAPLMAGFLKTAKDLHAANRFGVSGPQIRNVLDAAYKDLKPVLAKAKFTNLTNIEELFSAIDSARQAHQLQPDRPVYTKLLIDLLLQGECQ